LQKRLARELSALARVSEILAEVSPKMFSDLTEDFVSHKSRDCARAAGIRGMKLHSLWHTLGT
jgi:hypothetical protein